MKKVVLDKEEMEIERDIENYKPVSKARKKEIGALIEKGKKSRAISLRINERDLERLKLKANKNGLPYQTMINVVIHKYVTDNYFDKDDVNRILKMKRAG